jgi:hypothetical protein
MGSFYSSEQAPIKTSTIQTIAHKGEIVKKDEIVEAVEAVEIDKIDEKHLNHSTIYCVYKNEECYGYTYSLQEAKKIVSDFIYSYPYKHSETYIYRWSNEASNESSDEEEDIDEDTNSYIVECFRREKHQLVSYEQLECKIEIFSIPYCYSLHQEITCEKNKQEDSIDSDAIEFENNIENEECKKTK